MVCCPTCATALAPRVHRPTLAIRRALFDVPVVAGLPYQGVAKRVLTHFKERGVTGLGRYLAKPLRAAIHSLNAEVSLAGVSVVCVPHSRAGWVKRGRHPTRDVVAYAGLSAALAPITTLRAPQGRGIMFSASSQKDRSRRDRLATPPIFVAGRDLYGQRIVLVDDVLTTGISLEYAARAITQRGGVVVGGVVIAATPPRAQKISM